MLLLRSVFEDFSNSQTELKRNRAIEEPCYTSVTYMRLLKAGSHSLDCFKCVSVGGDNQPCEDPFHNNYTKDILEAPCWAGRKQRDGVFPATACIKLSGIYEDSGETMVVRGCALDSGTLTIDTEIVRMSHCGGFYFDNRYVSGCLQSCSEDACNRTSSTYSWNWIYLLTFLILMTHAQ
ncbi:hypothetical protein AVEN_12766-1 [Araneus ventricosus]|uniref:Protein sleepless n=1 Tax=Araneus ventricosus TaxID=182803 RepID=A0A4Y2ABD4_ARAVE|nr:hypothetical protein AVEN_12766-1 [Araneus ventricosus]